MNDADNSNGDLYNSHESQGGSWEEEVADIFPNVVNEAIMGNDSDSHTPSDSENSDLYLYLTVLI